MIELREKPEYPKRELIKSLYIEMFPTSSVRSDGNDQVLDNNDEPMFDENGDPIYVDDYMETISDPSLGEIVDYFKKEGVDLNYIYASADTQYDDWGTLYGSPHFSHDIYEDDESYNVKLELYNQELKEYNKWARDNKQEIKEAKAELKRQKAEEVAAAKELKKRERLERKRVEIERKLNSLNERT